MLNDFFFCTGVTVIPGPPDVVFGGASACFDGDYVRGHGTDQQGRGNACDDMVPFHGPVQQKHFDQRLGPGSITICFPCGRPESIMGSREDPLMAGVCQGGGTGETRRALF